MWTLVLCKALGQLPAKTLWVLAPRLASLWSIHWPWQVGRGTADTRVRPQHVLSRSLPESRPGLCGLQAVWP